jgi:aminoglycoside phosphotransferase (APT) family kinase protein
LGERLLPRDTAIDLEATAAAIESCFPELRPVRELRVIGAGFNSVVVETADAAVFRVARAHGTHDAYARERALLPALRGRLPVAVPDPRWYAPPSESFPHGAIGYPKLPGATLTLPAFARSDMDVLARDIAGFLHALHGVAPDGVPGIPSRSGEQRRALERATRDELMPALREHCTAEELGRVDAWWDGYLSDEAMLAFAPRVTHGDLWYENLLVEPESLRLTGVLDWELAACADPARDFAGLKYFGAAFMGRVFEEYERLRADADADAGLRHRTQRVSEVREFYGLRYGLRYPASGELPGALRKLHAMLEASDLSGA